MFVLRYATSTIPLLNLFHFLSQSICENQNKLIQQNANDKVLDMARQTQREIDRQRGIAQRTE